MPKNLIILLWMEPAWPAIINARVVMAMIPIVSSVGALIGLVFILNVHVMLGSSIMVPLKIVLVKI